MKFRRLTMISIAFWLPLAAEANAAAAVSNDPFPQLVAKALSQQVLTSNEQSQLRSAANDVSFAHYPARNRLESNCQSLGACVFGDKASTVTVDLVGDSHAVMWLPALVPVAIAHHFRLQVAWLGLCSYTDLKVMEPQYGDPSYCDHFRQVVTRELIAHPPTLALFAGRTSEIPNGSSVYPWYSSSQIEASFERSLGNLKRHRVKMALLEDTPLFPQEVPECLSRHPTHISECAAKLSDPLVHRDAERKAARAVGATFISTSQWLCRTTCPAVIGGTVAYADADHLTFAFAARLSGVLGAAVDAALNH